MELSLTFYIKQPVVSRDLEHLTQLVRDAIDEKIGEYEYLIEDVRGYDVSFDASEE